MSATVDRLEPHQRHDAFLTVDLLCHYAGLPSNLCDPPATLTTSSILPTLHSSVSPNPLAIDVLSPQIPLQGPVVEDAWQAGGADALTESFVSVPLTDATGSQNYSLVEEQMKAPKTKAAIGLLSTLIAYVSVNSWFRATHPEAFIWQEEDREEATWIATSKSWIDRKACRWLGVCGGAHMRLVGKRFGHRVDWGDSQPEDDADWQNAWSEGNDRPEDWTTDERVLREIPEYVLDFAPLVHLYSGEQFWPCDIAEHLFHITPALNYTPLQSESQHPTLRNLDKLNDWQNGRWVFLTSNDNVEERPKWLEGEKNIPSTPDNPNDRLEDNDGWLHYPGRTYLESLKDAAGDLQEWFAAGHSFESDDDLQESKTAAKAYAEAQEDHNRILHEELKRNMIVEEPLTPSRGGRSDAPAVLIVVNKGHGVVDAFWFFFYSFNLGNVVFNVRFGNHVGDWEHTCIRFHNGKPKAVFFSEHNFGSVYSYDAVEKRGKRPVIYSALGTHAMYATPGPHPYILPWGILKDQTDRGPLWDPALNSHAFTYDYKNRTLRSSNLTPQAPTEWFNFAGHWGDKFYPLGDKRQYRFAGQYHYVNGPLGPKFKNLGRKKVCAGPDTEPCVIKHWLGGENRIQRLRTTREEADLLDLLDEETERAGWTA